MAFVKFNNETKSERGNVWWHRAERDGAPFRGSKLPLLKEEEFEELAERVFDCKFGTFDTSDPDNEIMGRKLAWVLDAATAGWVQVIYRDHRWCERDGLPVMFVYIEWAEPYQELPEKYQQT